MTWITGEAHPVLQLETDAAEVRYEDSGRGGILEIDSGAADEAPFVRLYEWTEGDHPFMESLVGRRVRVTVEVLPGGPNLGPSVRDRAERMAWPDLRDEQ